MVELMESTTTTLVENLDIFEKSVEAKLKKVSDLENKYEEKSDLINDMKDTLDYCNEIFIDKFSLPIYPDKYCEKCKKKLRIFDDEQLKYHMESVHRIFKCEKCAFKGESESGRSNHMKKYHKEN